MKHKDLKISLLSFELLPWVFSVQLRVSLLLFFWLCCEVLGICISVVLIGMSLQCGLGCLYLFCQVFSLNMWCPRSGISGWPIS